MLIEIHLLQNFAPSNLNRDDTGSPKDCEFGGHRRARVSSQCWKRAVREFFAQDDLIPEGQRGVRTKKLAGELAGRLVQASEGRTLEQATSVATAAVNALGIGLDTKSKDEPKTSVLLFLGNDQIDAMAALCNQHWDALLPKPSKKETAAAKEASKEIAKEFQDALKGSKAVDLALFGRMIAEDPAKNVDAACQVAHAISTHRVAPEFDYYTAVDDLGRDDETGAGMVGTQEFNSACFYRYANIDLEQLTANLENDRELALAGVRAFLQGFVLSVPKAKQNGSAAQNLPSLVMVVARERGLASLANAFVKPVDGRGKGLISNSVEELLNYWDRQLKVYGKSGLLGAWYASLEDSLPGGEEREKKDNVVEVIEAAMKAAGGGQ